MRLSFLVDNDVLIKLACYGLLHQVGPLSADKGRVGVLGAARFVVRGRLRRPGTALDRAAARAVFDAFLGTVAEIEPHEAELALASLIEDYAIRAGVDLDSGESQLCAIAVHRGLPLLLTGDKRAIGGLEVVQVGVEAISVMAGRIVCLEQAIAGVVNKVGPLAVKTAVCAEPGVDKALSICFECTRPGPRPDFRPEGLTSYVEDLRRTAPTMLYPGDSL